MLVLNVTLRVQYGSAFLSNPLSPLMQSNPAFISTALPLKNAFINTSSSTRLPRKPTVTEAPSRSVIKSQMMETAERTSWLSTVGELFFGKDEVCIPQHDPSPKDRQDDIEKGRRKYNWRHDGCADASMIDGLPLPNELPRLGWLEGLFYVIIGAVRNNRAATKNSDVISLKSEDDKAAMRALALDTNKLICRITSGEANETDIDHTIRSVGSIITGLLPTGRGNHFNDYKAMYKTLELDVVCEKNQFLTDEIFGWYRIGGANCMRLMKITDTSTKFPQLTDEIFRSIKHFENDSLRAAADSNRLYYVEYPEFDGIPDTKPGRYVYSPVALFAVPLKKKSLRESLLPIAIHCKPGLPMFTPNSDKLAWIAAKSTVQTTDALTQTSMYHLGRCHLLIEVFNCATHRAFAENHPLYKLLLVHFSGTALMNYAATKTLIQDGNQIDQITSPSMESLRQLAAKCINSPDMFNFNEWMVDNELAGRGVMSDTLVYPYRDDALKVWNAIMRWVRGYVDAYYKSDADVVLDHELQHWCFEIHDPKHGNLPGFGDEDSGRISTVETLVRTVTMIIFTASAQHSATNFPQGSVMQYAPAMPFGGYTPALDCERPYESMDEMVAKVMPPLDAAAKQMFVTEVLGTFRYSRLGDYGNQLKFAPRKVQVALKQFQDDLARIAVQVGGRNEEERELRLPLFDYMNPCNIPQSINI